MVGDKGILFSLEQGSPTWDTDQEAESVFTAPSHSYNASGQISSPSRFSGAKLHSTVQARVASPLNALQALHLIPQLQIGGWCQKVWAREAEILNPEGLY